MIMTIQEQVTVFAAELKQEYEEQVKAGCWEGLALRVMLKINKVELRCLQEAITKERKHRDRIVELLEM
jgi:hypothetical protein